jgi:hypothetical protein
VVCMCVFERTSTKLTYVFVTRGGSEGYTFVGMCDGCQALGFVRSVGDCRAIVDDAWQEVSALVFDH